MKNYMNNLKKLAFLTTRFNLLVQHMFKLFIIYTATLILVGCAVSQSGKSSIEATSSPIKKTADSPDIYSELYKAPNRFEYIGDGDTISDDNLVKDPATGLTWQRCPVGQNWAGTNCKGKAKALNFEAMQKFSFAGWRLPTIEEFYTLLNCRNYKGELSTPSIKLYTNSTLPVCKNQVEVGKNVINKIAFPDGPEGMWEKNYWTSSKIIPKNRAGDDMWTFRMAHGTPSPTNTRVNYTFAILLVKTTGSSK